MLANMAAACEAAASDSHDIGEAVLDITQGRDGPQVGRPLQLRRSVASGDAPSRCSRGAPLTWPQETRPPEQPSRQLQKGISRPLPEELFVELLCLRAWGDAKIGA
jgi:hypothetical protein